MPICWSGSFLRFEFVGLKFICNRKVPTNDSGIALGQAAVANAIVQHGG